MSSSNFLSKYKFYITINKDGVNHLFFTAFSENDGSFYVVGPQYREKINTTVFQSGVRNNRSYCVTSGPVKYSQHCGRQDNPQQRKHMQAYSTQEKQRGFYTINNCVLNDLTLPFGFSLEYRLFFVYWQLDDLNIDLLKKFCKPIPQLCFNYTEICSTSKKFGLILASIFEGERNPHLPWFINTLCRMHNIEFKQYQIQEFSPYIPPLLVIMGNPNS